MGMFTSTFSSALVELFLLLKLPRTRRLWLDRVRVIEFLITEHKVVVDDILQVLNAYLLLGN